jgi:hypothetical protein
MNKHRKVRNQKMRLNRETLRNLSKTDLHDVRGGTTTNCPGDPTYGDLCTLRGCGGIDK